LRPTRILFVIVLLSGGLGSCFARAQEPSPVGQAIEGQSPATATPPTAAPAQDPVQPKTDPDPKADADKKTSTIDSPQPKIDTDDSGKQTKRILGIIPNYRSVNANTYLPPQSFKEKFWLATQDSFDYSSFIYEGLLAGAAMAENSEPSFHQGAAGYGRYFWHTFADGTIENYMVESIVPTFTKEDSRYYTLGKGGFFKRTGYAASRTFITRKDSGSNTFNFSEIIGAGAAAGISNAYYPSNQNQLVKTYQRWISQMIQDGVSNIAKEFWPDINHAIFHSKY
jgi:hypothetical protein